MEAFAAVKFIGSTVWSRVIRLQRSWVLKGRETTAGEVAVPDHTIKLLKSSMTARMLILLCSLSCPQHLVDTWCVLNV